MSSQSISNNKDNLNNSETEYSEVEQLNLNYELELLNNLLTHFNYNTHTKDISELNTTNYLALLHIVYNIQMNNGKDVISKNVINYLYKNYINRIKILKDELIKLQDRKPDISILNELTSLVVNSDNLGNINNVNIIINMVFPDRTMIVNSQNSNEIINYIKSNTTNIFSSVNTIISNITI